MPQYDDSMQAVERNPYIGAFADLLRATFSPERTQQAQGVAKFMGAPAIASTLDRMSYGDSLTTGRGQTLQMQPDVAEAALAVAPFVSPAARLGGRALQAGARELAPQAGRMAENYMNRMGMQLNAAPPSNVLAARIAAPQDEALRLAQQRASLPVSQGGLGLPAGNTAQQRAQAMGFDNPMFHETEGTNIENGLLNFDVRRVGAAASDEQTPYAMFLKPHPANIGIARQNPAQMPVLVKTDLSDQNIRHPFADREELQQYLDQFPEIKKSTQAVRDLDRQMADYMAEVNKKVDELDEQGKTQEADKLMDSLRSGSKLMKEFDARMNELSAISKEKITDLFKFRGIGTVGLTRDAGMFNRSTVTDMVLNPAENVRSRFAAFDPFRKTAATATAMGVAAPDLLAVENKNDINQMRKLQANKK